MAGKGGRGGWQEIMRDHIFNVPGKYIFWLFFTIKGGCILQKHGFKADFFLLTPFELELCIITWSVYQQFNTPMGNHCCPESTRCYGQCVIPYSWCQSIWSKWQLSVQPVTKMSSKWRYFRFIASGVHAGQRSGRRKVPGCKLHGSNPWNNSLIIAICLTVNANRHVHITL